jgi:hypothetical protein
MDIIDTAAHVSPIVAAIAAVAAAVLGYTNRRKVDAARERAEKAAEAAADAAREVSLVHGEVREVGARIDGRLSELLKSSNALARSEGIAAGEQSQRDRQSRPEE